MVGRRRACLDEVHAGRGAGPDARHRPAHHRQSRRTAWATPAGSPCNARAALPACRVANGTTSSCGPALRSPDTAWAQPDYLSPATIDRWLKERVLLQPETTQCAIPWWGAQGGGRGRCATPMLRMVAYGGESHIVCNATRPGRPQGCGSPSVGARAGEVAHHGHARWARRCRGAVAAWAQLPLHRRAAQALIPAAWAARPQASHRQDGGMDVGNVGQPRQSAGAAWPLRTEPCWPAHARPCPHWRRGRARGWPCCDAAARGSAGGRFAGRLPAGHGGQCAGRQLVAARADCRRVPVVAGTAGGSQPAHGRGWCRCRCCWSTRSMRGAMFRAHTAPQQFWPCRRRCRWARACSMQAVVS